MSKTMLTLAMLVVLAGIAVPAGAESEVDHEFAYGYFYGTFGEDPNTILTAGAPAEDFCPEGFDGSPGTTTARTSVSSDGTVDVLATVGGVEIHLYEASYPDAPSWIADVCDGIVDAEAFASGVAVLRIHDTYLFDDGPPIRLFNSVSGHAAGQDGTRYQVNASAEIPFDGGVPVGTPPDWVTFELDQIGR
jgi:hypothetical protein